MEQSLSERIACREFQKEKSSPSKNKVAFIALQNDIENALEAGWSMKVIWETLSEEGKITFGYKTFRIFVSRLIKSTDKQDGVTPDIKNAKDGTKQKKYCTRNTWVYFSPYTQSGRALMKIHITMQGKGGVGKSFVSAITAQYKIQKGQNPLCIDTDPINATFHGFKALNVQRLEIMEGDEINSRHFDLLIERIAPTKEDVVIDNGASSFVPLSHYLISNQVPSLLKELGHDLVIHTVITGGQALLDTVHGFSQLIHQFSKEIHFVVWLNPYWGAVTYDGKDFEQMKVYRDHKERIASLIHIPALKEETYGRDLTDMLQKRITFNEALNDAHNNIMTRQRLKIIRDQLFDQLNNAVVI